jgi:hypothetical protein
MHVFKTVLVSCVMLLASLFCMHFQLVAVVPESVVVLAHHLVANLPLATFAVQPFIWRTCMPGRMFLVSASIGYLVRRQVF